MKTQSSLTSQGPSVTSPTVRRGVLTESLKLHGLPGGDVSDNASEIGGSDVSDDSTSGLHAPGAYPKRPPGDFLPQHPAFVGSSDLNGDFAWHPSWVGPSWVGFCPAGMPMAHHYEDGSGLSPGQPDASCEYSMPRAEAPLPPPVYDLETLKDILEIYTF